MTMRILVTIGLLVLSACGGSTTVMPLLPINPTFDAIPMDDDDMSMDVDDDPMDDPLDDEPPMMTGDVSFGSLLNNLRFENGDNVVTYDSRIDAAAQGHADDMIARGYLDHDSPEGEDVRDRLRAQGYEPSDWGENIALSPQTEEAALDAWINSPNHNAVLEADRFSNFALGVAGTGANTHWVLVMATEE